MLTISVTYLYITEKLSLWIQWFVRTHRTQCDCIVDNYCRYTVPPRLCPYMIGPRHYCAQTRLCPDTIVPRHDVPRYDCAQTRCAQTRLCPDKIVPRHYCAQTRLCPDTIVPRHDVPRHNCAQTRLCQHELLWSDTIMSLVNNNIIIVFTRLIMCQLDWWKHKHAQLLLAKRSVII